MITRQQAIEMFESDDLIDLGMQADTVRKQLHPEGVVSYCLEAETELSNAAIAKLDFEKGQSIEDRVNQLESVRRIQEQTGGFVALDAAFAGTAVEYLKALAISRIYLDNITHVQSSPRTAGLKVCQIALRFGANDLGAIGEGTAEEQLRRLIRDAGFVPKQRDALFQVMFLI